MYILNIFLNIPIVVYSSLQYHQNQRKLKIHLIWGTVFFGIFHYTLNVHQSNKKDAAEKSFLIVSYVFYIKIECFNIFW